MAFQFFKILRGQVQAIRIRFLLEQVNEAHYPLLAMVNCTCDVYRGEMRWLCP